MALINCNFVSPRNHDECFEDGEPNRIVHVAFVLRGTSINTSSEATIRNSFFIAELAETAFIARNITGTKPAPSIKEGKGPGLLNSRPVGKEHTITGIDFQYVDNISFWADIENAAHNYDLYYWTSNLLWKPAATQVSVSVSDPITDDLTTEIEATFTVKWSEKGNPITFPSDANDFTTIESEVPDNGIIPAIQGASTNSAGTQITLAYNELLSGTPSYTVSGGKTITRQVVSGSSVIITVSIPYVNGNVITISGGGVTDQTGNAVAALTNYSVTNNAGVVISNSWVNDWVENGWVA